MEFPWYLLVPLLAAGVYAVGSLFFKQAYAQGAGMMDAFFWMNFGSLLAFTPLLWWVKEWPPLAECWKPAVTAGFIYSGTLTTFAAIRAGDVSLVTPLMGTKVVFTALLAVFLAGTRLPPGMWAAALLTTVGVLVLGWRDLKKGQGNAAAVGLCLLSSVIFAGADVLIGHWGPGYGRPAFLGTTFGLIGLLSLATVRWQAPTAFRVPGPARRHLGLGAALMNAQTVAMGLCIVGSNDPTGVNILYGTRGLWSIALVWFVGRRWFGNGERDSAHGAMGLRLTGSLLILGAVVVAVLVRR